MATVKITISIHSPRAGGDSLYLSWERQSRNFNPLPPCGGRPPVCGLLAGLIYFNPLPPCGGRLVLIVNDRRQRDFNPLPPCGGRPVLRRKRAVAYTISIHSPRAGGDIRWCSPSSGNLQNFNPLPPCGGRRFPAAFVVQSGVFQSTPPVRGETHDARNHAQAIGISIHSPRAGGDHWSRLLLLCFQISIHSPRAGGDQFVHIPMMYTFQFQSTPPVRGETWSPSRSPTRNGLFQSTPPVRGETAWMRLCIVSSGFQSTPPVRGETRLGGAGGQALVISIHSPRAGGDTRKPKAISANTYFNPLPPCGGRRHLMV